MSTPPGILLHVNGASHQVEVLPETPLLWVLRDTLGLTATVYGCGAGRCGACTVHVDGEPVRSCQLSAGEAAGCAVTSVEGLAADPAHPIHGAIAAGLVPPASECRCGQVMRAAAVLSRLDDPSGPQATAALAADPCRCDPVVRLRARIANRRRATPP